MTKEFSVEVVMGESGKYFSRLRDQKGKIVSFRHRPNGLPKKLDAVEEKRFRDSVQFAFGKIFKGQNASQFGADSRHPKTIQSNSD